MTFKVSHDLYYIAVTLSLINNFTISTRYHKEVAQNQVHIFQGHFVDMLLYRKIHKNNTKRREIISTVPTFPQV